MAAPPFRSVGGVEVVAVRLSDGAVRLYRARPGCVTREEVETACWALAWRDGAGRWHSLVAGVELRAEETTWWDWPPLRLDCGNLFAGLRAAGPPRGRA